MGKGSGGASQAQQLQQVAQIQAAQQQADAAARSQAAAAAAAAAYTPGTPQSATPSANMPSQYMPSPQAMEAARNQFNARLRGQEASILGGANEEDKGLTQEERDRRRKNKLTSADTAAPSTQTAGVTPPANTYSGTTLGG